jgi:hypothetical protein
VHKDEASLQGGFIVKTSTSFIGALAVAVALLLTKDVFAAQQVTIPEGTVIEIRMETGLNSENSRQHDHAAACTRLFSDGQTDVAAQNF